MATPRKRIHYRRCQRPGCENLLEGRRSNYCSKACNRAVAAERTAAARARDFNDPSPRPAGKPAADVPARRKCLSCEKQFNSAGFGNRLCPLCAGHAAGVLA